MSNTFEIQRIKNGWLFRELPEEEYAPTPGWDFFASIGALVAHLADRMAAREGP